jgi:hypothetical protein
MTIVGLKSTTGWARTISVELKINVTNRRIFIKNLVGLAISHPLSQKFNELNVFLTSNDILGAKYFMESFEAGNLVMPQFGLTPRALANFSPGFEHSENPGYTI